MIHMDDPSNLGYFVSNKPALDDRESEVIDTIHAGTATQNKLQEFLTHWDNPKCRKEFVITIFQKYLDLTCFAIKKFNPIR